MPLVLALSHAFGGDKRRVRHLLRELDSPWQGDFLSAALGLIRRDGRTYLLDGESVLSVPETIGRCLELRHLRNWSHILRLLSCEYSVQDAEIAVDTISRLERSGFFARSGH